MHTSPCAQSESKVQPISPGADLREQAAAPIEKKMTIEKKIAFHITAECPNGPTTHTLSPITILI